MNLLVVSALHAISSHRVMRCVRITKWQFVCRSALAAFALAAAATITRAPGPVVAQAADAAGPFGFEVQRVSPSVYALIRTKPLGFAFDGNSAFIINRDSVIVVDSGTTLSSATAAIAALKRITSKPVSHVINTHWHDDHVLGNAAYRDAFPKAAFVAHSSTTEDLVSMAGTSRKQTIDGAAPLMNRLRNALSSNTDIAGGLLEEEERTSYAADLAFGERYLQEIPHVLTVGPSATVAKEMLIPRVQRTAIRVLHLGRGHTRGDLVVLVPDERVLIAGDLVVSPVPLVGTTSYPADFSATLEQLLSLGAAAIVPGHGAVLRNDAHVRLTIRLLKALSVHAEAAAARKLTLKEARSTLNLKEFREAFAGANPVRQLLFDNYVAGPGFARAFELAGSPHVGRSH